MALLHRDRPATRTDDTVAGAGATDHPTGARHAADDHDTGEPVVVRKNSVGQTIRTVVATILLVAVVAVAAANTDEVTIDLLFGEYRVELWAIVAVTALAGLVVGALLAFGRRTRVRT